MYGFFIKKKKIVLFGEGQSRRSLVQWIEDGIPELCQDCMGNGSGRKFVWEWINFKDVSATGEEFVSKRIVGLGMEHLKDQFPQIFDTVRNKDIIVGESFRIIRGSGIASRLD